MSRRLVVYGCIVLALVTGTTCALAYEAKRNGPLSKIAPAPEFTLTTQDGTRLTFQELRGRIVVVTFIYTGCADTCPLLTAKMAGLQARLGADFGPRVFF